MPLGEFAPTLVENSLRGSGVCIAVGTFLCRIHSDTGLLSEPLLRLYSSYPASIDCNLLVDFEIDVRSIRSRHGREVEFHWEGKSPFPALPLSQTHPLFEWGLNWAIATLSGSDIVIHSAVVEKMESLSRSLGIQVLEKARSARCSRSPIGACFLTN